MTRNRTGDHALRLRPAASCAARNLTLHPDLPGASRRRSPRDAAACGHHRGARCLRARHAQARLGHRAWCSVALAAARHRRPARRVRHGAAATWLAGTQGVPRALYSFFRTARGRWRRCCRSPRSAACSAAARWARFGWLGSTTLLVSLPGSERVYRGARPRHAAARLRRGGQRAADAAKAMKYVGPARFVSQLEATGELKRIAAPKSRRASR